MQFGLLDERRRLAEAAARRFGLGGRGARLVGVLTWVREDRAAAGEPRG
jgi:hypothetical protein